MKNIYAFVLSVFLSIFPSFCTRSHGHKYSSLVFKFIHAVHIWYKKGNIENDMYGTKCSFTEIHKNFPIHFGLLGMWSFYTLQHIYIARNSMKLNILWSCTKAYFVCIRFVCPYVCAHFNCRKYFSNVFINGAHIWYSMDSIENDMYGIKCSFTEIHKIFRYIIVWRGGGSF